jgi:hypothetical protein
VVQERFPCLAGLLGVDVAVLSGERVHLAEQARVDVVEVGQVETADPVGVLVQRRFGVGAHDPFEDRDCGGVGEFGDGAQHGRAGHQVGQPLRALVRV